LFVLILDESLAPIRGLLQRIADGLLATMIAILACRSASGVARIHAPAHR
jgi:hypothetical protein